jgi:hypothetical protein
MISMTTAINKLPEQPSKLGEMGIFKQVPINTTTAVIEERQGKLSLVQTSPRGTRTREQPHAKRTVRSFVVPHLQEDDSILADAIQGIRDFGNSDVMETVTTIVNNRLENLKQCISATREWQRVGAVQGIIYDADGTTVLYNLFNEFGVTQPTYNFDFSFASPTVDVKTGSTKVRRIIEHAIGATPFTGIQAICGDDFWDAFITCASVKTAYLNWQSNQMLQGLQRGGFQFGDITWWNYSTKIGSTFLIPPANAFFIPSGSPDLFLEYLAPADYIETVNTMGKEYYAKQEIMPYQKGINIQAQSNPLNLCTRPGIVVKGTFST